MASKEIAKFTGPYGTVTVKKYDPDTFVDMIINAITPSVGYIVETEGGSYEFFDNLEDAIEEARRLAGVE